MSMKYKYSFDVLFLQHLKCKLTSHIEQIFFYGKYDLFLQVLNYAGNYLLRKRHIFAVTFHFNKCPLTNIFCV